MKNKCCAIVFTFVLMVTGVVLAGTPSYVDVGLLNNLIQQGVQESAIMSVDETGVPRICGTGLQLVIAAQPAAAKPPPLSLPTLLPVGTRSWECVPGVIRNNATDTFHLEVDVNGPVNAVMLRHTGIACSWVSGPTQQSLRDDGLEGDRVSGDHIYTSGAIRYNTNYTMPDFFGYDTNSPAGLMKAGLGAVEIIESSAITNRFLINPSLGILRSDLPMTDLVALSSNVIVSPHLINIVGTNRLTQRSIRFYDHPSKLTRQIYADLPDAFDFLMLFSMDHIEHTNRTASVNFVAGMNMTPRVSYTGTGLPTQSNSASFGSAWRLQGVNLIDACNRGVEAFNATHELMHQWSAYVSPSLGLTTGDGHFLVNCNILSTLGGKYWVTNENGTYEYICPRYPTRAAPLEKYMAGLIPGSAVTPLQIKNGNIYCNTPFTNVDDVVSIEEIQAVHGIRTPTPATAQKDFSIGFVAESLQRPLNPVEMTFYEILATEYTRDLPPEWADPAIEHNWVTIERYFGEGTTWSSEVLGLIQPHITNVQHEENRFRVDGTGYPGETYRLLGSTNLNSWIELTNQATGTDGSFTLQDNSLPRPKGRWYKVSTP